MTLARAVGEQHVGLGGLRLRREAQIERGGRGVLPGVAAGVQLRGVGAVAPGGQELVEAGVGDDPVSLEALVGLQQLPDVGVLERQAVHARVGDLVGSSLRAGWARSATLWLAASLVIHAPKRL